MRRKTALPQLIMGILLWPLVSCTTPYNPLDDFEERKPASVIEAPKPLDEKDSVKVEHGRYMVELLGCAVCHTEGALVGRPESDKLLAGSRIGIAYSNPLMEDRPGVVFPGNLTPDRETGLGNWSDEQILRMINTGVTPDGHQQLSVMPWPAYASIKPEDADAIVAYLRALKPVKNRVPENNLPGQFSSEEYVYFGVYQSFE